jgi:hypothetical protein
MDVDALHLFLWLLRKQEGNPRAKLREDGIAVKLKGEVHGLKSKAHDSPDPATDGHDPSTFVGLFPIGRGVTRSRRSRNLPSILVRSMNVTIEQLSVRTSYSLDAW